MERRVSELDGKTIKYITSIFDFALRQVKFKLELDGEFMTIEYEIYPSDADRIVITVSGKKVRGDVIKGEHEDVIIPIVDNKTYSVSIENLRLDNNKIKGDVSCFTWYGSLVTEVSPTEFYMADVKAVKINRAFEVDLTFEKRRDVDTITNEILTILDECVRRA